MRGSTRRAWVKLFVTGWLHGSVRWQLDAAERGTFADLIAWAGECGREGEICDNDGRAFPPDFIANQLHIPLELLQTTITKCEKEGRIKVEGGVILITNWKAYQSEYDRQRPYRQKGKLSDDPDKYVKGQYGHMVKR